jgi:uncharacterized membrane protein HdeD (DUF308 family)
MSLYGLARNWWWIVLRGLFAGVFVLVAFLGSYDTLVALVRLFGAYALVDGLVVLIADVTHSHGTRPGWLLLLEGLLSIGAGTLAFLSPGLTAIGLVYLLVGWAIVRAVLEIIVAIRWHGVAVKARLLTFGLLLAAALAALLALWPVPVSSVFLWLAVAYTLIFDLLQIGVGLRVRNWQARWMKPLHMQPGAGALARPPVAEFDLDRAISRTLE